MKQPEVGDIARCRAGDLGLILNVRRLPRVRYEGIHIARDKFGRKWESMAPEVYMNIDDLLYRMRSLEK